MVYHQPINPKAELHHIKQDKSFTKYKIKWWILKEPFNTSQSQRICIDALLLSNASLKRFEPCQTQVIYFVTFFSVAIF